MAKRVKLDREAFAYSSIAEKIIRVRIKDSFKEGETLYFVIYPGSLGKALGKGATNIKRLQEKFNSRIRFVEFSDNCARFIKNLIYPLKVEEISESEEEIILKDSNKKTKSLLIGRDAKNLKLLNNVVDRYFNKTIKVE